MKTTSLLFKSCLFILLFGLAACNSSDETTDQSSPDEEEIPDEDSNETSGFITSRITLPFADDLRDIHFFNENTGIIVGGDKPPNFFSGVILRTENGGQDWEKVYDESAESFSGLTFVNQDVGYAASNGGRLVNTQNGGQDWSVVNYSVWENDTNECIDCLVLFDRIQFVTASEGYTISMGIDDGNDISFLPEFLKTEDGGKNWYILEKPLFFMNSLHFFDTQEGIVSGHSSSYPDLDPLGYITKTYSGGTSAVITSEPIWQTKESPETTISDFHFINESDGFAVSSNGILKTTDKGESWEKIDVSTDENTVFNHLFFINSDIGFITTENEPFHIAITLDGGSNWEITNRSYGVNNLYFVSEDLGFLIEDDGYITKYEKM